MWLAAGLFGSLLLVPYLLPKTQLVPLAGVAMWWSILALRAIIAVCIGVIALLYVPASGLFDLLTAWCMHAVVPFFATHLGLSGHQLGDAAVLVPALVLILSAGSALIGILKAAHAVARWLRCSALGAGPEGSVLVSEAGMILGAAGLRAPRVVVSHGALAELDDAELAAGLQHEWGHVRRGHRFVTVTSVLLLGVSRFLPGGKSAYRHLQFHLERDADQYAVQTTGDPLALASAICKVAAAGTVPRNPAVAGLDGTGAPERLRILLDEPASPPRPATSFLAGAVCVAVVAVTLALALALPMVAHAGAELTRDGPQIAGCA